MENPNVTALDEAREELKTLIESVKSQAESFERGEATEEQTEKYDNDYARVEELQKYIAQAERAEAAKKLEIKRSIEKPSFASQHVRVKNKPTKTDYNNALRAWIVSGSQDGGIVKSEWQRSAEKLDINLDAKEFYLRDQSTDTSGEGQEILDGSKFQGIVEAKEYVGGVLDYCDVVNSSNGSEAIHYTKFNDTAATTAIKAQNAAVVNTSVTYSNVSLGNFLYSSGVFPVSLPFIQDARINVVQHINDLLTKRYYRKIKSELTNGVGTTAPRGYTIDATTEGSSAVLTAFTPEDIYDLYFSVDAEYRESDKCAFVMHDQTLAHLMSEFVDSDLRPIWGQGLNGSPVLTLMGKPIVIDNNLPTPDYEASLIYFGDWSAMKVRFVGPPKLVRDDSRLVDTLSVFMAVWGRFDCAAVLHSGNEAIKVLNTAAS